MPAGVHTLAGRVLKRLDSLGTVASFPDDQPGRLVVEQIRCSDEQQQAAARAATKARARQKALDRSRRNTNPDHYGPSTRLPLLRAAQGS